MTTLQELWDALNGHDWFYGYSDSHEVFTRGADRESELLAAASKIPGGLDMANAFGKHHFSGPSWNTPKAPKPERPA